MFRCGGWRLQTTLGLRSRQRDTTSSGRKLQLNKSAVKGSKTFDRITNGKLAGSDAACGRNILSSSRPTNKLPFDLQYGKGAVIEGPVCRQRNPASNDLHLLVF